jgi:putative hydroxymethylpyrimidine transport system substrate-binding protein
MMPRARAAPHAGLALCAAVVLALGACGNNDDRGTGASGAATLDEPTEATLVLDFVPNAVHTGIYCALDRGYYDRANIELEIIEPTSTSDTLKLIDQGRASFGLADGIDVGQQIDRGLSATAIMAVVQRPLGGVITLTNSGIRSPRALEGKTVGITGVPSDDAVLDTVISADGGDTETIEEVTIGFNTIVALQSGRVDAITGYPPADATQIELQGPSTTSFRLDEWGGPRYPGLMVFSTRKTIERDPELMQAFVEATVRGYEETIEDPQRCLDSLLDQVPEVDDELAEAQLDAYLPLFKADVGRYGSFDRAAVIALLRFLRETSLVENPISPRRYATHEFVTAGG